MGMAGGDSDFAQDTGSVLSRAMSMKPLFGEDPGAVEEYWRKSMVDPAMGVFKKQILPETREIYAGTGALSSGGRYRAETEAGSDLATQLGSMLAQALWGERTAARGEKQSAMTRAMSAIPLGSGIMDQLLRGGMVERETAREPLTEEYNKWQMSQPWASPWLGMGMDMIKQRPGETYLQEQQQPWYSKLGQSIAGAGTYGMGKQFAGWMGGGDEKEGGGMEEILALLKKLTGGGG